MSDEFDREFEKLEAQLRVTLRDLEEANARLREKPETLLYARCVKHVRVPQLNEAESSGAECGACAAEKATRLAWSCSWCGELREPLRNFARRMEENLRRNDCTGRREAWLKMPAAELLALVNVERKELAKLVMAAQAWEPPMRWAQTVADAAAALANFAMMIADNYLEAALNGKAPAPPMPTPAPPAPQVDLRKEFRCPRCGELQRNDGQFYPLEVGFMQAGGTLLCFACREWCRTQNHGDGTMAQA